MKDDLHLSVAVNPDVTTANAIKRMLLFPEADKVETFMRGRVELVESIVRDCSPLIGLSLAEVYKKYKIKILACAARCGKEVYIPDGSFVLQAGDKLHVAAAHQDIKHFFKAVGQNSGKIKNVMICGGGRVCYYLANQLIQAGMQVKIIEWKKERCEELSDVFPKATVICGDATDHELLL